MDEATELLSDKLSGAKQKMQDCEEDLDFLREQITVSSFSVQRIVVVSLKYVILIHFRHWR